MKFGDKWRRLPASYWDVMAERSMKFAFNRELARTILDHNSVIEIGCGAGHFARVILERGYRGAYWGCDISAAAVNAARERLGGAAKIELGQFENLVALGKVPTARLAVAGSVIQHQKHWLPMVKAAMRQAPRVLLGISRSIYFKERGEHDVRDRGTWFDVCLSLEAMKREAQAAGLACDFTRLDGPHGPEVVVDLVQL